MKERKYKRVLQNAIVLKNKERKNEIKFHLISSANVILRRKVICFIAGVQNAPKIV